MAKSERILQEVAFEFSFGILKNSQDIKPRCDIDCVKTLNKIRLSDARHFSLFAPVHRFKGIKAIPGAGLDLDETRHAFLLRNDIDLAETRAVVRSEYPVAIGAQKFQGEGFSVFSKLMGSHLTVNVRRWIGEWPSLLTASRWAAVG